MHNKKIVYHLTSNQYSETAAKVTLPQKNIRWKPAVCNTVKVALFRDWEKESHTISAQHERSWWPKDLAVCHSAGYDTGVISHIWRFHFGDVEVTGLLRHKSPAVLLDKRWILVEDPSKWQLWSVIKIKIFGKVFCFFSSPTFLSSQVFVLLHRVTLLYIILCNRTREPMIGKKKHQRIRNSKTKKADSFFNKASCSRKWKHMKTIPNLLP